MSIIEWKDEYSVRVKEIDAQHQKLVEMINELHTAMAGGKSKDILSEIIQKMVEYTQLHFRTEEKYFDEFNYPQREQHKNEHNSFIEKVTDFSNSFNSGKVFLSIEVMDFLKDWLANHITGSDQEYSDFFTSKGLN